MATVRINMCILGFNRRGGVRSLARFAVSSTRNMTVDGRLSGQIPDTARLNPVTSQIYRTPPASLHWMCQWKSAICFFFNLSKKSAGFYFINDCDLSCVLPWNYRQRSDVTALAVVNRRSDIKTSSCLNTAASYIIDSLKNVGGNLERILSLLQTGK